MPSPPRRRWVLVCLGLYALAVGLVVLTPVSYSKVVHAIADWLELSVGIGGFGSGWIEFAANILMFLPLGFLLTLLFSHPWYGVALAVFLSCAAELAQFVIPSREPAVRDIVANAAGAALGAVLAWLIVLRREHRRNRV